MCGIRLVYKSSRYQANCFFGSCFEMYLKVNLFSFNKVNVYLYFYNIVKKKIQKVDKYGKHYFSFSVENCGFPCSPAAGCGRRCWLLEEAPRETPEILHYYYYYYHHNNYHCHYYCFHNYYQHHFQAPSSAASGDAFF